MSNFLFNALKENKRLEQVKELKKNLANIPADIEEILLENGRERDREKKWLEHQTN